MRDKVHPETEEASSVVPGPSDDDMATTRGAFPFSDNFMVKIPV